MELIGGEIVHDELTKNSMGGTEQLMIRLHREIPHELLQHFHIVPGRFKEVKEGKIPILWIHDTVHDPMYEYLKNGGWRKFAKIVFVSDYQQHLFVRVFGIPWSRCITLMNAIDPIEATEKPTDEIRLIYTSTPQRGLNILIPVFSKLAENNPDIVLDVFSSYQLYGWPENDKQFEPLFKACADHPKINYYGAVSNEVVREHLQKSHIFSYPSTWEESSCICLIEAMSAGLTCVHPNFGALFETASRCTRMYQYHEDSNIHAGIFMQLLQQTIIDYREKRISNVPLIYQKQLADSVFNWKTRREQWIQLLTSTKIEWEEQKKRDKEVVFAYER